jgi:hypothetical protein
MSTVAAKLPSDGANLLTTTVNLHCVCKLAYPLFYEVLSRCNDVVYRFCKVDSRCYEVAFCCCEFAFYCCERLPTNTMKSADLK